MFDVEPKGNRSNYVGAFAIELAYGTCIPCPSTKHEIVEKDWWFERKAAGRYAGDPLVLLQRTTPPQQHQQGRAIAAGLTGVRRSHVFVCDRINCPSFA
jgi:hypothetical protein